MRSSKEKLVKDCEFAINKIICNGSTYVTSQQFFKEVSYYLRHSVEVVTCKNCMFGEACKNGRGEHGVMCNNSQSANHGWVHEPGWYCADGEDEKT